MIRTLALKLLSSSLCLLLVIVTGPFGAYAQQASPQPAAQPTTSDQPAPLKPEELQQLAAPIALYPDALVAQVLGASTFPDQVAAADNWMQQNKSTGDALLKAVDAQTWDPSVKALTQFPSVLDNLAKNLGWTSALGEAYSSQPADLMSAIQVLRAKAKAAGNLKTTPEIKIVQESPQTIIIQPANPQIIYVPTYNPTIVYGYPYVVPGYSTKVVVTTAVVAFGVGIAVGMAINGGYHWGWSSWNCGWHSTTIVYRGGSYHGNPAWHGGYNHVSHYSGYNSKTGTYSRGTTVSNGYGTTSAGQAYNPRTGASASTVQTSNRYGSAGATTATKNGTTVNAQHQSNANGTTGQIHSSNGASAYGAVGRNGNSAVVGQTANGDKFASVNGNTHTSNSASRGYGTQSQSNKPSAFSGTSSSGWQSRSESSRGAQSTGGGTQKRTASHRR